MWKMSTLGLPLNWGVRELAMDNCVFLLNREPIRMVDVEQRCGYDLTMDIICKQHGRCGSLDWCGLYR